VVTWLLDVFSLAATNLSAFLAALEFKQTSVTRILVNIPMVLSLSFLPYFFASVLRLFFFFCSVLFCFFLFFSFFGCQIFLVVNRFSRKVLHTCMIFAVLFLRFISTANKPLFLLIEGSKKAAELTTFIKNLGGFNEIESGCFFPTDFGTQRSSSKLIHHPPNLLFILLF